MAKNNGVGAGPLAGLGDITPAWVDPMERYFRILRGQTSLPRRGWIVQPQWTPPQVPGMELFQKIFEEHEIPRNWQLLEDFFVLLLRGRFMVKRPNWIEPPATASMQDVINETPVALGTDATEIVSYTVPDRCVAAFHTFGQQLSNASQWGNVTWNILVNKKPIRTYQDFLQQRGAILAPVKFPSPILLKGRDVLSVTGARGATATNAVVRLQGYIIPAEIVTQDGSYRDWNSR